MLNSIAPEPKLTRTMIICEDVNRNDNNADNPGLLTQQDAPPDGTINVMNNQEQNSLFCAPASPERSPSVMEQKPNVWRQQLVQPQRGLGGGSRAEWDSSNRPVRLPVCFFLFLCFTLFCLNKLNLNLATCSPRSRWPQVWTNRWLHCYKLFWPTEVSF